MSKIYGYCRVSTKTQRLDRQIDNITKAFPSVTRLYTEKFTGTKVEGRTEFKKMLKVVKANDTIVFDSVSRMSRNADEGVKQYFELFNKGITLVFLKEPHFNTDVYKNAINNRIQVAIDSGNKATDKFVAGMTQLLSDYMQDLATQQIRLAFEQAEKEVKDSGKRVSEGMRTTQKNNLKLPAEERTQIGQRKGAKLTTKKSIIAKQLILDNSKDFNGNDTDVKVIAYLKGYEYIDDAGHKTTLGISNNTYYKYKRELLADAQ